MWFILLVPGSGFLVKYLINMFAACDNTLEIFVPLTMAERYDMITESIPQCAYKHKQLVK